MLASVQAALACVTGPLLLSDTTLSDIRRYAPPSLGKNSTFGLQHVSGVHACSPDKDALQCEAASIPLLCDCIHVALTVPAGRVLEPRARSSKLWQLQKVRRCRLNRTEEGVQSTWQTECLKEEVKIG